MEKLVLVIFLSLAVAQDNDSLTIYVECTDTEGTVDDNLVLKAEFTTNKEDCFKIGEKIYVFDDGLLHEKLALEHSESLDFSFMAIEVSTISSTDGKITQTTHSLQEYTYGIGIELLRIPKNTDTEQVQFIRREGKGKYFVPIGEVYNVPKPIAEGNNWWYVEYKGLLELKTPQPSDPSKEMDQ